MPVSGWLGNWVCCAGGFLSLMSDHPVRVFDGMGNRGQNQLSHIEADADVWVNYNDLTVTSL